MSTLNHCLLLVLVAACLSLPVTAADARRPNLVFVFSDQQSWDMLGCYGNDSIRTPNFDRLASAGVRFNHCISNSPVCTPYRGILFSGQHPLNQGAIQNDLQMLPGKGTYFAEVLRDAGYRTGYFGKWHLYGGDRERGIPPGPCRYGFDHEFLVNNCTLKFDAARAFYWDQNGKDKKLYGDWEPYAQTRQAMEFVDRHADKPFALFLSWHPPHNWGGGHEGYAAPEELLGLYDPAKVRLRPTVADTPQTRRAYQGHMAMISGIDRAFGQLLEKLDEHHLTENTIVVFTSDHGDMLRSYGWPHNKGRAESSSCRVPLLIRWPARLKPGTSDLLMGTFDLMPSLLGMMGLRVPATCQGRNAAAAILDGRDDGVDALPLFYLPLNWRGVYTRRHTYSVALHDPAEPHVPGGRKNFDILYDREVDPWETRNLFDSPDAVGVRNDLHARTLAFMKSFGDTGMDCREIIKQVICDEDLPVILKPLAERPDGSEGRLKGRPVDILGAVTPEVPAAIEACLQALSNKSLDVAAVRQAAGANSWKVWQDNPVLQPGAKGEWDAGALGSMSVVKVGRIYHMYYEAWGDRGTGGVDYTTLQIGHAVSLDGLHWAKDPANPVLPQGKGGDWDKDGTWDPFIIHENGQFKMWYGGGENTHCDWAFATSADGSHFVKQGQISHLGNVEDIHVVHDTAAARYLLYYWDRRREPAGLVCAESSNETAFDFGHPVKLTLEGEKYPGMYKFTHVIREAGEWVMFYSDFVRPHCANATVRMATSPDGLRWTSVNRNLLSGQDGEVLKLADQLYLLYFGPQGYFDRRGCDIRAAVYAGDLLKPK